MTPTKLMIVAARRAEFDYHQKGRLIGAERFIPTPDPVIKVMLEAALKLVDVGKPAAPTTRIVQATKPRSKR
jgi:hypothetical protein